MPPWVFGAVALLLGAVGLWNPRLIWWLSEGWKFRDAEPSDLALIMGRVTGVILVLVGIWLIGWT